MLLLTPATPILLAIEPIDFRKQIDGLVALCHRWHQSPKEGTDYVFINRRKTMIKILSYDDNGYWLASKRLSQGRYLHWPKATTDLSTLLAHELRMILKNTLACQP